MDAYDTQQVKAASEAAARDLLRDPDNARYRATVMAALGKLTAARSAEQLDTLYGMALSMKNTYEEKDNDAGARAVGLALQAIETGYHAATGQQLEASLDATEDKSGTGFSSVGVFAVKGQQRPGSEPRKVTQIMPCPDGALTISEVAEKSPNNRLYGEIKLLFEQIRVKAEAEPGILHEVPFYSHMLGETLQLKGGKFHRSNTINMDGEGSKRQTQVVVVDKDTYDNVMEPYLKKIAEEENLSSGTPAHVTPRGMYPRPMFHSFNDCLNNIPAPVMAALRAEVDTQLKDQVVRGVPSDQDQSRIAVLDGIPVRVIITTHGDNLAMLVHRADSQDLLNVMKTRACQFRKDNSEQPGPHSEAVRSGSGSSRSAQR